VTVVILTVLLASFILKSAGIVSGFFQSPFGVVQKLMNNDYTTMAGGRCTMQKT
jgi:hypothetical protein